MITMSRRTLLRSATMAALAAPLACTPVLAAARPFGGCCLCHANRFGFANGEGIFSTAPAGTTFTRSSGDAETDRLLGMALLRLATTFQVSPGFVFFDDHNSPNAFANPDTLADQGPGTVMMGKRLFAQQMSQDHDDGVTMLAILAHEFGHIYQFQSGIHRQLDVMDKTSMPVELHADFMAGSYLALRKAEHPDLNLQTAGAAFFMMGDTDFSSPQHHGTCEQRIASITAGYAFAKGVKRNVQEIAEAGVTYVRRVL